MQTIQTLLQRGVPRQNSIVCIGFVHILGRVHWENIISNGVV